MYQSNGEYGKVRFFRYMPVSEHNPLLHPTMLGWHECNDLYHLHYSKSTFDKYLIFVTISGTGCMELNNVVYSLPVGTIAILPRNNDVKYYTPKGGIWEFYWLYTSHSCNFLLDSICEKGLFVNQFDPSHNYKERIENLIRLIGENSTDNEIDISLEMSIILHFCAMDLGKTRPVSLSKRAYIYITQNFKKNFSLKALSDELYVSTSHLIRSFKKDYGCTPHQFLINYRLSYSVELLKFSNMQIDEIANSVGFFSSSHYISAFKKKYRCTPGQYK